MRKIIVSEFISLDSVIEDPGGAEKFEHGGWTWNYFTENIGKWKNEELVAADALLLGRTTYQAFAAAWQTRTDEWGYADRMNNYTKFVVSTSLTTDEWKNSQIIKSNVADELTKIKQQPGKDILIFGSGKLVQSLMPHNLIDEYRLMVYPIVLGSGKRLFDSALKTGLQLVDTKNFEKGVVVMTYISANLD